MRKTLFAFSVAILTALAVSSCGRGHVIEAGIITDGGADSGRDSLAALLSSLGFNCSEINIATEKDLKCYDVLWYHRDDTSAFTEAEIKAPAIKKYVSGGGRLILSMDAVRLVNEWGVEPQKIEPYEYEAVDGGFGRKVGFHAFREHPLFDGMSGGAYVWHGHEDNTCRVLGFPEGKVPEGKNAKTAGIFWEYIFYHPEEKVIWEESLGKGKILSIGGLLYYGRSNYNKDLLERFTLNCVNYMAGKKSGSRVLWWDYSPREIVPDVYEASMAKTPEAKTWRALDDADAICWKAERNEVDIPSRRSMTIAKESGGIFEIWTHPFLSVRDVRVFAETSVNGRDTLVQLDQEGAHLELRFNSLQREYTAGNTTIDETIVPSVSRPQVVTHYEWSGGEVRRLIVDFKHNLRYMWPYDAGALGSIHYGWAEGLNAFVSSNPDREFVSMVGSNAKGELLEAGRYDIMDYRNGRPEGRETKLLQVMASVAFDVSGSKACDIVFSAGSEGWNTAVKDYRDALKSPEGIFQSSAAFYEAYLENHVSIETPDTVFNKGYRWALGSAAQFMAETPGMGLGMMAGYSSSMRGWGGGQDVSGRPGYAWYFGRDSEWGALAFLEAGDLDAVRATLEMLMRFQRVDGKIFHEATTSGSIHYDASDATPFFVVLMARYLEGSGDVAFIRSHEKEIRLAMDYCLSTDTDGDHLIENTHVGHGWLEGGDFFGSKTELILAATWERALKDAAVLMSLCGDETKAAFFTDEVARARLIIESKFWNAEGAYYNYGIMPDDSPTRDLLALAAASIYLGDLDRDRSRSTMEHFASTLYSRDWGVTQAPDTVKLSYLGAYTENNIWPLFTGAVSLAEYKTGRYVQGFSDMMANIASYLGPSPGRVPEVLSGEIYRSNGITRHQCWSETMAVQPALEGMLGFRPYALEDSITLAPRLPEDWTRFNVGNLRCGSAVISAEMTRRKGEVRWLLHSTRPVKVVLSPSFAPGTRVMEVKVNGRPAEFSSMNEDEYIRLSLPVTVNGDSELVFSISDGITVLPKYRIASPGDPSRGAKILKQEYSGGHLKVTVEGYRGTADTILVYDRGQVIEIEVVFPKGEGKSAICEIIL